MSNRKDPDPDPYPDPDDPDSVVFLLLKSFKLADELKVGDKILFWELLLTGVLEEEVEDDKNSGSTLEETEVVAR